ncbi:MAG: T9SS type A sorting domain-containing protein [Paludibacter sp.]
MKQLIYFKFFSKKWSVKVLALLLFVFSFSNLQAQCTGTTIALNWGGGTVYNYTYDGVRNGKCSFKQAAPGTSIQWTGSQWSIYGNNSYTGTAFFHSTKDVGDRPSGDKNDWVSDMGVAFNSLTGTGVIIVPVGTAPTVSTQAVSDITSTTATGNGNITDLGSDNPTAHGVCWNTTGTPTTADSKTDNGAIAATGSFTSSITGLSSSTKYYVKAYATNTIGTAYGDEVNFTTSTVSTDYFRSKATGNWNDAGTWESSNDNTNWVSATLVPTAASAGVTILNAHAVTITANAETSVLTLNTGSVLNVDPGIQFTVGTTLVNDGTLNLLADASTTATILTPASISGSGTSTVQQNLTTGRNWYISSPVSGATANMLSASPEHPVLWYDEVHGTSAPWVYITDNSSLNSMQGYVLNPASSGAVTFSGSLNTGAKEIVATRTAGQTKAGFNLVGNPYPSYLNWDNVTKTNLSTTMWYRTKTAPAQGTGISDYVFDTYNATGGVSTSLGTKAVTNLIPPMQAFWVLVNSGQSSGALSVTNSQRAHADNGSNTFKSKSSTSNTQPLVRLEVSNGLSNDQALVYFNASASNSFDSYDSPKMSNGVASIPEIYTLAGTEQVVINGLKDITQITLGFSTGQANNFSIKASQFTNFVSGTQIILRDNLLNTEQDLTVGDYKFYSEVTANNENRFTLLFKAPSVATGINSVNANVWISTNASGQLIINGNVNAETSLSVYNAVGQRVVSTNLTSNINVLDYRLSAGVYTVTLTSAGKTATTKIIIN